MPPDSSPAPDLLFFPDDGAIPNSDLPLLLYQAAWNAETPRLADEMEQRFASHGWTGAWRAGVYPFHHYHSTSHEVLGVFAGEATLLLGGEGGRQVLVKAGDVIVIPAGVGHRCLESSDGFGVVGAYPDGRDWDLLRGNPGERPEADENIARVPRPSRDPVYGSEGPLLLHWSPSRGKRDSA